MPASSSTLEQLFDRTWRPGHPFRPRLSPLRRWGMFCFLCFLLSIISGYWYLTESKRVQRMCETYLSQLTGGQVKVRKATLSIFEGLRLDGVSVRTDKSGDIGSTLFEANTILIKSNPESILSGKLQAAQIVAIDPRVHLCEDMDPSADSGRWNYQRMTLPVQASTQPGGGKPRVLPEIRLRNGQVHYSQIQNKEAVPQGTMTLDGVVTPGDAVGECIFQFQSRVAGETIGPSMSGKFEAATGESTAELRRFEFGPGIKAMLPDDVRKFWIEHQLAGRVDIPSFYIKPRGKDGKPEFRVQMDLQKVEMAVDPNQWLGRSERQSISALHGAFDLLRVVGLNCVREAAKAPKVVEGAPSLAVATPAPAPAPLCFIDRIERNVTPSMIRLERVDGTFIFTQEGIEIQELNGLVERNWFQITGHIDGYAADAPATIHVLGDDINIPHSPRYVTAMPRIIREVYEGLHPEGNCKVWVQMLRPDPSKKPLISGGVEVLNG